MIGIIESNGDGSEPNRFPVLGSRKNDILHPAAAKGLCALLSQYPSDSIGNIALAASVWSNDRCLPFIEMQNYSIGKGFKPLNLQ